jgi:hypothetical protein
MMWLGLRLAARWGGTIQRERLLREKSTFSAAILTAKLAPFLRRATVIVGAFLMMFGLMNIAFNFDQLAKALQLAYSGEAPTEVQEKAAEQTENEKNILKARDFMRYKEACGSNGLLPVRTSVFHADTLASSVYAPSQTTSPTGTLTDDDGGRNQYCTYSQTHIRCCQRTARLSDLLCLRSVSNIASAADPR